MKSAQIGKAKIPIFGKIHKVHHLFDGLCKQYCVMSAVSHVRWQSGVKIHILYAF